MFLATGLVLALTDVPLAIAAVVYGIFVVARWSHSLCYRYSIQPWRTISFAIGGLDQLLILVLIGYYVFVG